jgi:hypothetical protein
MLNKVPDLNDQCPDHRRHGPCDCCCPGLRGRIEEMEIAPPHPPAGLARQQRVDAMKALRVNAVTDPTVTSPATVMPYQNLSGF